MTARSAHAVVSAATAAPATAKMRSFDLIDADPWPAAQAILQIHSSKGLLCHWRPIAKPRLAPGCVISTDIWCANGCIADAEPSSRSAAERSSGQPALLPSLQPLDSAPLHSLQTEARETVLSHQQKRNLGHFPAEPTDNPDSSGLSPEWPGSTFELVAHA